MVFMIQLTPLGIALLMLGGLILVVVLLVFTRRRSAQHFRRVHGADDADVAGAAGVAEAETSAEEHYRKLAEDTHNHLVEAQLRSLRAQISPHFIYNSLNVIASLIPTDPVRARELVLEFADFTRYSLRSDTDFTTLAEELDAVERYVLLQKARFADRIQVSLSIAPEVLGMEVPFLAVQPLVENAMRHGLKDTDEVGYVHLSVRDEGTHAVISVEDGGVGADPEYMAQVLRGEAEGSHIGLRNVDLRLRQAYGGDHGLTIDTAPDAGMRVWLRIPKFRTVTAG